MGVFFKSLVFFQCSFVYYYIFFVLFMDVLFIFWEIESGLFVQEVFFFEEFFLSYVLCVLVGSVGVLSKDVFQNFCEVRGKVKQILILNGWSVIIKDVVVYSNKGKFLYVRLSERWCIDLNKVLSCLCKCKFLMMLFFILMFLNFVNGYYIIFYDYWLVFGRRLRLYWLF